MNPYINIAIRAARKAATTILRGYEREGNIKMALKKPNDFVTEVDKQAEKVIVETLLSSYPEHGILAEEGSEKSGNEFLWIIDPIDGTTNFIRGIPHFAISIALQINGRTEHGVIYDPVKDDLFYASRGDGAVLNEKRIRVTSRKELDAAIIATGFSGSNRQLVKRSIAPFNRVLENCSDIRRCGAASLDLAYVAAGKLDGYWEYGLNSWDIAAGALMVREAGGLVADTDGSENYLESGNIVTANPKLFKQLLPLLQTR